MSIVSIRAALKTQLDALVTGGTLGTVFNGEQPNNVVEVPAWPAVEIVRSNIEPDYLDNRDDFPAYVFRINIYQQLEEDNWHTVEIAGDALIDAILQALIRVPSLSGASIGRMRPMEGEAGVL